MNFAHSNNEGFWWAVSENPKARLGTLGIYIRVGQDNGVVLPRDEAEALLEGLKEVLYG